MKFTASVVFGLASIAAAASNSTSTASGTYHNGTVYTTEVVTAYTTYCPAATVLTVNSKQTITVSEATTLTITDCPCTITKPVNAAATSAKSSAESSSAKTTAAESSATHAKNGTASATTVKPVAYTGAANKASFAGAAGVFALAAFAL